MPVFSTKRKLNSHLRSNSTKNHTIGLVPTMGALHSGHLSLVKKAILENDQVVVSIFVNPTQFNNEEDLLKYPKTMASDVAQLEAISDNILIFAPSVKELYPEGTQSETFNFNGLDMLMEGRFREGHFDGVGTVVEKLLKAVGPDRAYFGEKDFQQLLIIQKLVALKEIPVQIIGCPIVREPHGLAMSSRNERLSTEARQEAGFIYRTLLKAKERFAKKSAFKVKEWVTRQFEQNPRLTLEYIQIADATTLRPLTRKQKGKKYRAFVAVYAEGIRLIDNIAL